MKKNLVLGSLIMITTLQAASPAMANKETIGNIIGGVIGGALGSQIGGGSGKTAATIIGAIAGTMIGGKVGRDLDEADRRALADAQRDCFNGDLGRRHDWDGRQRGSRTGARGYITTSREGFNRAGEYCREYTSVIYTRQSTEETRGIACTRRDGSWYEVRESEVRFGSLGRDGRPSQGGGRHNNPPPPRYDAPSRNSEASVQINQITRRSGGEWYRITLARPVSVESIEVRVLAAGVRLHETAMYTASGNRLEVRELTSTPTLRAGDRMSSERLYSRDRIQVIDVRAESMGGNADISVKVVSDDGYPSMTVTRF